MADKRPRAKELRELPETDLAAQLDTLRQELWRHRIKARDGALQQTHQIPAVKRQIARVQTVLNAKPRHPTATTPQG